nr:MAG TPA: hypothetical protein [Bacteriophage sp.]
MKPFPPPSAPKKGLFIVIVLLALLFALYFAHKRRQRIKLLTGDKLIIHFFSIMRFVFSFFRVIKRPHWNRRAACVSLLDVENHRVCFKDNYSRIWCDHKPVCFFFSSANPYNACLHLLRLSRLRRHLWLHHLLLPHLHEIVRHRLTVIGIKIRIVSHFLFLRFFYPVIKRDFVLAVPTVVNYTILHADHMTGEGENIRSTRVLVGKLTNRVAVGAGVRHDIAPIPKRSQIRAPTGICIGKIAV